jgi:hypothetical protein
MATKDRLRRLSATPNVMLRRPTLEEARKSQTNIEAMKLRREDLSQTNLRKQQTGRDTQFGVDLNPLGLNHQAFQESVSNFHQKIKQLHRNSAE